MEAKRIRAFLNTQGIVWDGMKITRDDDGKHMIPATDEKVLFLANVKLKIDGKEAEQILHVMTSIFWICNQEGEEQLDLSEAWTEYMKQPDEVVEQDLNTPLETNKSKPIKKKKIVNITISEDEIIL